MQVHPCAAEWLAAFLLGSALPLMLGAVWLVGSEWWRGR